MSPQPRPDNLGTIPYADTADPDPGALPFGALPPCDACGAEDGEPCRPGCIGEAAHLESGGACGNLCLSLREDCTACGDGDDGVLSDGRCARCHRNGNPAHSWCPQP